MMIPIVVLLISLATALLVVGWWTITGAGQGTAAARLRQIRAMHADDREALYGQRPSWLLSLLAAVGGFLPASEGRAVMRTGLLQAGIRDPRAPLWLLGTKAIGAVLLPVLAAGLGVLRGRPAASLVPWLAFAAVVGFYLPTMVVAVMRSARRESIRAALPDALDLMVVCVEAGLGIAGAMQRVANEIRRVSPPLADELTLVHHEMQGGVSRADALRALAARCDLEELDALVTMLVQTDRLGTSVAQALRAHATDMRIRRRQRVEKLARQASVKLAFPLVLLIFPALLVVLLGPALHHLMRTLNGH